ncbi:MAG: metal-sensitive transcriptional regulator [Anaerolineae bacterium]|nr:metal-sensitive transcriptional regulator [Anaerolineae bacterium]
MQIQDPELIERLGKRLRRIEGQVRGIESMLSDGRECREIIQQLSAIQSALHSFSRNLLEEYAINCLLPPEDQPINRRAQEQNLRELIDLLNKAP